MHFASDNWAGAHPRISKALHEAAGGFVPAYGASNLDRAVEHSLSEIFERDLSVFFVGTGTAANSLSMALANRPGGVAFCHREAHMIADECGAPEYLTGGGRLCPVDGDLGRMDPAQLEAAIARYPAQFVHSGQPMAVSITQASEIGTVYELDHIERIAEICRANDLPLHMDGARFANALVSLDTSPADMTWKRGIDIVSFGGTKNGCWCAEAVVVFDRERAAAMPFLRKRAAQLFSKSRFIAAQFEAYLADGLWLETARHSNAMAVRLADRFESSDNARLPWRPQANEVFPILKKAHVEELRGKGAIFHPWNVPHGVTAPIGEDETLCRFVTSFATTAQEVDGFAAMLG